MSSAVRIECTGADVLELDKIEPFQGSLKTLSKQAFQKLKKSIIDFGFSFPVFVWRSGGRYFTLDGHQRIQTLKEMRKDGFIIPPLPVVWIDAADEKEAKHKLLLAVGQYGKVTDEGLYEFIQSASLDMGKLNETIELSDLSLERFIQGYSLESATNERENSNNVSVSICTCPKCGYNFEK